MVNLVAIGGGVAAAAGLWNLAGPIFHGNNEQGQGPYDSRLKRAAYATAAVVTGAGLLYAAPVVFPALAGASAAKTVLATTALAITAPGVISRIWNGDKGHRERLGVDAGGPYSSFSNRALGHVAEGIAGASLMYLAAQHPEVSAAVASTAGSALYNVGATGLSLAWGATKIGLSVAANTVYYGAVGAGKVLSGIASTINGIAAAGEAASNATSAAWSFASSFFNGTAA